MKFAWPFALLAAVTACSKSTDTSKSSGTSKDTAKPGDKATDSATAPSAAKLAPPTSDDPPPALVDKDLSPAGKDFAGWTAKGPADAKVVEDLGGARIVTQKVTGFDLAFKLGAGIDDLKDFKAQQQKAATTYNLKIAYTTDTPDALVWTTGDGSSKSYDFRIHAKVSGKDVTCYTVTPRDSEDALKFLQAQCATIAKK
jgi:hypothetical protein|nr:hypothetical protein [Kofleriaceae bacterium]